MGRRHRGRRLLVHDPCPPRRRGDRLAGSSSSPIGRWGRRLCSRSLYCVTLKTYGLTHVAKNPRATFKDPITVVIVSLGLVRFRRAAASMEAKIRSIGTIQLPYSHRILMGSKLVSRYRIVFEGIGDA